MPDDVRWFAPNAYGALVTPALRDEGVRIALDGDRPARLAMALGGGAALAAWSYARRMRCPLIVYLWDLPPRGTGRGRYDPVWCVAGRLVRIPRPVGGYRRRRGYYSRLRWIAARADAVWVPSEFTRLIVAERFGVEATTVPYCYDSERFRLRSSPGARSAEPTLLTVSRLQPHKNQAAVVRAAARLGSSARVRLIGRGPEADALRSLAAAHGVRCSVETDVDDDGVVRAYQSAAVAVAPSRFEGFGLGPVEAIACGVPTVASDIPPHREFAVHAATMVPLDDDDALAGAIERALGSAPPSPDAMRHLTTTAAAARFRSHLVPYLR